MAVHLPIGMLVLLPILEIAGARKPALREAAEWVLGLACVTALGIGYGRTGRTGHLSFGARGTAFGSPLSVPWGLNLASSVAPCFGP